MKKYLPTTMLLGVVFLTVNDSVRVSAQAIGAAPSGEATVVAQKIIHDNFEKVQCPLVVQASRIGDGSIKAFCNNGMSFRVFSLNGNDIALNCSAAAKMGVRGC